MNSLKCKNTGKLTVRNPNNIKSFLRCVSDSGAMSANGQSNNDPITFEFNDTFFDLSDTYEFQHHANGPAAIGIDKSIDLTARGSAVVDLGNDFFSPYSHSIAFDYKTSVTAGPRLSFSTMSDIDNGPDVNGIFVSLYDQWLYWRSKKETTWPGNYFAPGQANVSAFDFTKFVRMVFVFNHSFNHTEGDKNNIKMFVNGQMVLNQDIADNLLTQAERDAGILFLNPQKLYLNRIRSESVSDCSFDNIKLWRDALTDEEALAESIMQVV